MKNLLTSLIIIILQLSIINSAFAQDPFQFTPVANSALVWGDYNNDGFDDLLLTGEDDYGNRISKIYLNNTLGGFEEQTQIQLTGVSNSSVARGGYNNDNFLDILCWHDKLK